MNDLSRVPGTIGEQLRQALGVPNGLVPGLSDLVKAADLGQGGTEDEGSLNGAILSVWGSGPPKKAASMLRETARTTAIAFAWEAKWRNLFRLAQAAALGDQRLSFSLEPHGAIAEDPHIFGAETLYEVTCVTSELICQVMEADMIKPPSHKAGWPKADLGRMEQLSLKPSAFGKVFGVIVANATPEYRDRILEQGPLSGQDGLYRLTTAAAVLGFSLQIGFTPSGPADNLPIPVNCGLSSR